LRLMMATDTRGGRAVEAAGSVEWGIESEGALRVGILSERDRPCRPLIVAVN
jgi:hypothetical protein